MQYHIQHSCGHEVTHQIFGKNADRVDKIEWLKGQPCLDCKREAENEAANNLAAEQGLPPLVGSPKQVAWANTLRQRAWDLIETNQWEEEQYADGLRNWVFSHTQARWWIDLNSLAAYPFGGGLTLADIVRSYEDRQRTAALEEKEKEDAAYRRQVLDTLQSTNVKVWTGRTGIRRIYSEGVSIWDSTTGPAKHLTPEQVACCEQLAKKWKSWSS
jgi:hypothetical protein